jgi:hypothetical protein
MEKKRTHVPHKVHTDPIKEALEVIVPSLCDTEHGKQMLNILSRFTGYHMSTDMRRGVDKDVVLYNEAMRNVYRYFREFIPTEKLAEIEHGVYPYDVQAIEEKETN